MMQIVWFCAMFGMLPKRRSRCDISKEIPWGRPASGIVAQWVPCETMVPLAGRPQWIFFEGDCTTFFACFPFASNPQIYGTGVYNAAVLAVSSACSHMRHSTSPCSGQSSSPWCLIFKATRHLLRQHLHFLRPNPDLSTPKARAATTEVNQCMWEVFLMLWGTDLRQFVAAFVCLEEGYWAERMVASYSLSYSVDERVHSYSKDSHAEKVFS
jgi:hypothetical protein